MVGTIISFILAGVCFVISIFQFREKGFCFNNAYLYASKEERKKMDKSPHYRQSAIVFLRMFFTCGVVGIYAMTHIQWLLILEVIIIAIAVAYAVISSIRISKK